MIEAGIQGNKRTPADVVRTARQWIGTPYHHQASCLKAGVDCCGVHTGVCIALGIPLPIIPEPHGSILLVHNWHLHHSRDYLYEVFCLWDSVCEIALAGVRPGDFVLCGWPGQPISHALIVTTISPALRFIHSRVGKGVREETWDARWQHLLRTAFRLKAVEEECP